jgi:hypothetical protein
MSAEQQQINYGSEPNDGTGDPLRTAFIKTDDNFDAIWAAGPVGSNVTIVNNTVSVTSPNADLVLKPNGLGVIQANASILPNTANIRDLGSAGQRWRSAWVGVGGANITGNVEAAYFVGNGSQLTGTYGNANVAAYLPTYTGNISAGAVLTSIIESTDSSLVTIRDGVEIKGPTLVGGAVSATGNVTGSYFIGNGSQLTGLTATYGNANVASYLAGSTGNIIPVGNNAQSLGNATNRWANLWLSGNTIQLGDLSLSAGAGGLTSTTGFDLANSTAANIEATGNMTADYFIGDGSQLTNLPFDASQIENGTSNVVSI